jgi:hypothetical protein
MRSDMHPQYAMGGDAHDEGRDAPEVFHGQSIPMMRPSKEPQHTMSRDAP